MLHIDAPLKFILSWTLLLVFDAKVMLSRTQLSPQVTCHDGLVHMAPFARLGVHEPICEEIKVIVQGVVGLHLLLHAG